MPLSPGARPDDLAARRRLIALLLLRGELAARGGKRQAAQPAPEDRVTAPGTPPPSGKDPA